MNEEMTSLTLEIISETIFGGEIRDNAKLLGEAVAVLNDIAMAEMKAPFIPPRWLPTAHNRKKFWAMGTLEQTIQNFIEQKRKNPTHDLLSNLLNSSDEKGKMTLKQVRDEAMVLFLAGHDTTAACLVWTWYSLSKHPEIEKKVIAEIAEVLGTRTATFEDVAKLKYLNLVILESLRLFPPAIGTFAREASEDLLIGGFEVPKKSFIWTFSFVTQRDPRWFPRPEIFDPDRFSPQREKMIPQLAYFPFGGGPRACIGKDFALAEITLVMATILQNCRPRLKGLVKETTFKVGVSLRPAEKLLYSI
jgi:cytochrome P450